MTQHPPWALKFRKKGTELRLLNGYYYLYEVTSKWNPEKKRSQKVTGKLLGKITETDGFIESEKAKLRKQNAISSLSVKEYGFFFLYEQFLREYTTLLKRHFEDDWQTIIALAYGRLLYGSPLKNMSFHYSNSYLSEVYGKVNLSPNSLSDFLRRLGIRRESMVGFFREFNSASDCIIFDGTDMNSNSSLMDLPKNGKSKQGTYQSMIDLMFVFSVEQHLPIYYRIMPGNIKDVKSFRLCLEECRITDAVLIMDKGFYSKSNLKRKFFREIHLNICLSAYLSHFRIFLCTLFFKFFYYKYFAQNELMLYLAGTMYVDDCTYQINGKTYRRVLLRQSYRDSNGKTQHRNIANISSCSEEEIQGIKFVLKHKDNIDFIRQLTGAKTQNWKIVGPSLLLQQLSNSLGIAKALGHGKESNYILWQVFARLIQPCSRLGAVRLARNHCGCELLGIESIRENDLYESLVWLYGQKDSVEDKLFKQTANRLEASTIFLYDVSSSYFEGEHNELASYGYNRDKKKGKKQLVYGLLTDDAGEPLSIEAFKGNTSDPATLKTQIEKIKQKYGCKKVAIVGDKGMIKSAQIEDIHNSGLNYITTITKPQIESLIKSGVFQMELFSEELVEIINREEKVRYILRRNPLRAEEMRVNRQGKIAAVKAKVQKSNEYLQEHPRARAQVQERQLSDYIQKLKLDHILQVKVMDGERQIELSQNDEELENTGQLDGCYVIKTDLIEGKDEKEKIHSLYQSLASVEWAFRTEKSQLEIRPIYLRKEHRTRGHLMVCMLAYKIEKHLRQCWKGLDITVEEGMEKLSSIVGMKTQLGATKEIIWIPEPDELNKQLLDRANVILPTYLPTKETVVSTNEKLTKHRK